MEKKSGTDILRETQISQFYIGKKGDGVDLLRFSESENGGAREILTFYFKEMISGKMAGTVLALIIADIKRISQLFQRFKSVDRLEISLFFELESGL